MFIPEQEGLFDDYVEETESASEGTSEVEEPTEEAEEVAEDTTEEATETEEPFLNVRYDKNDVALSKDDAILYAQKGMNYDRINSKYTDLYNKLERQAKSVNLDVDSYLGKLEELSVVQQANAELKGLKEKYPDADESLLREVAFSKAREKTNQTNREIISKEELEKQRQDEYLSQMIDRFKEHYPDVNIEKLDTKVYDLMDNGYTLLEAYNIWKASDPQMQAKERADKLNKQNKSKSYGSKDNVGSIDEDSFMKGFLE